MVNKTYTEDRLSAFDSLLAKNYSSVKEAVIDLVEFYKEHIIPYRHTTKEVNEVGVARLINSGYCEEFAT